MLSVLVAHNYYKSTNPSGENVVFDAEAELLIARGHSVHKYSRRSEEIFEWTAKQRLGLPKQLVWSDRSYYEIKRLIERARPTVAHFHNTFPLISRSAVQACQEMGVPVVQTLHNYRYLCINGGFFRHGNYCQRCLGTRIAWRGIAHRCYGGSLSRSLALTVLQYAEKRTTSALNNANLYIAPSQFVRQQYVAAGFPGDRIWVKPHFASAVTPGADANRDGAIFVGRLCVEKGVDVLLSAWRQLPDIRLLIIGDGPYAAEVRAAVARTRNIVWLGALSRAEVLAHVRRARCIVVPSKVPESFGLVAAEAMGSGTPVVASDIGALPELVKNGRTGLLVSVGDTEDLIQKVRYLNVHPQFAVTLGAAGREDYEKRFTPEQGYQALIRIYEIASGLPHDKNETSVNY